MSQYRICSKCIMDISDPDITFDGKGVCNYCREYDRRIKSELHNDDEGQKKLESALYKIKEEGRNKEHDCLIGVSGGADSSMVAYHVKRLGLRP